MTAAGGMNRCIVKISRFPAHVDSQLRGLYKMQVPIVPNLGPDSRDPSGSSIQQPFVMCAHTSPALRRSPAPLESTLSVCADSPGHAAVQARLSARSIPCSSNPDNREPNSLINAYLYPVPKIGGGL